MRRHEKKNAGERMEQRIAASASVTPFTLEVLTPSRVYSLCMCVGNNTTAAPIPTPASSTPAPSTCAPGEFRCRNGGCIHPGLRCDGTVDCVNDDSDEERCASTRKLFQTLTPICRDFGRKLNFCDPFFSEAVFVSGRIPVQKWSMY